MTSRTPTLHAVLFALPVLLSSTHAWAGLNAGGTATLTWSSSAVVSDLAPGAGTRRLYVRMSGITSIRAIEFEVLWAPGGGENAAYGLTSWSAPAGTTCTWLLRGTVITLDASTDSSLRVAATASVDNTTCTTGNAGSLVFSDPPPGAFPPGRFRLAYARTVDASGQTDELALGPPATILSGTTEPAPIVVSQFPATGWIPYTDTFRITGFNFVSPLAVKLTRTDHPPLVGTVASSTDRSIDASFSFTLADTGRWRLQVENPGGRFARSAISTRVVVENGGTGLAGGPSNRLILQLKPGTLPLTGPRDITLAEVPTGDASLRTLLGSVGARRIRCMWPEATPQRKEVRRPDGTTVPLFDFGNCFAVSFDSHAEALAGLQVLRGHNQVVSSSLSPKASGLQCTFVVPGCELEEIPDDPDFGAEQAYKQWYLQQTYATEIFSGLFNEDLQTTCAWVNRLARGNRSVIIGMVDSGIDASHEDLNRAYSNPSWGQKILPGISFVFGDSSVHDQHGHGTMMSGLAAARTANGSSYIDVDGNPRGIAGVAGGWAEAGVESGPDSAGARILPVRVLDDFNEGNFDGIVSGINWAANNGADVINLSLAASEVEGQAPEVINPTLRHALYNALKLGATCVAGIGNDNNTVAQYPARYSEWGLCTTVGATDLCGYRVDLGSQGSSYGPHLDVMAPGFMMLSTFPTTGGFMFFPADSTLYAESRFGTSHSAALVSGVAASLKGMNPILDDVDIRNILRETAENTTGSSALEVGRGRVNHGAAVRLIDPALRGAVVGWVLDPTGSYEVLPGTSIRLKSTDIPEVPDGTYYADRHEIRFSATFPIAFQTVPKVWVRVVDTKGWNSADPHLFNYGGGEVLTATTTNATFRTFVYYIPSLDVWVPNTVAASRLSFRAAGALAGTVDAPGPVPPSSLSLRLLQNPMHIESGLAFELISRSDAPVMAAMYDVLGRRVWTKQFDGSPDGLVRVRMEDITSPDNSLRAGVYFLHARQGTNSASARWILLR